MSNLTVKKIGCDSYFILELTILRTSATLHRHGHVATIIIIYKKSYQLSLSPSPRVAFGCPINYSPMPTNLLHK